MKKITSVFFSSKTKNNKNNIGTVILSVIALIQVSPFIWLILFSFKDNFEIFGENLMGLPRRWLVSNYVDAWKQGNVSIYFLNSVLVTGVSIVLTLLLSTMASYAITRMHWKLSRTALVYFLTGLMIPLNAVLFPLMLVLKNLKLLDSYMALIIPYTAFSIPMTIFIISGFFKGIHREMEEAACIDGAGIYTIFFSIMLPLVKPAVAASAVFTYLACWNELMFAVTYLHNPKIRTLTVGIQNMTGQFLTNWGPIGAGLVIATIPTIIIYVFLNRQVQESLAAGAIKG